MARKAVCGSEKISDFGHSANNVPRYRRRNNECETKTFLGISKTTVINTLKKRTGVGSS